MTVETGGPESKTRRYKGLYYVALDEKGNKISPPVMSSDLALFYEPYSLYEFASELRRNDIDLIASSRKDNQPFDLIYVDHRNKTAAAGRTLGEAYTADSVLCTIAKAIDAGLDPTCRRRSNSPNRSSLMAPASAAAFHNLSMTL